MANQLINYGTEEQRWANMMKMMIAIRGRRIRVQARAGQRQHYVRLYSQFTDERLDELEQERIADDGTQVRLREGHQDTTSD